MSDMEETVSMTLQELLDNGILCYQEKNYKGAIFYFEHYLSKDKENAEVLHVLAQLKCELGSYNNAVVLASAASELQPENSEFRFTLAENLFLNQELLKAEEQYLFLKDMFPLNTHVLDRLIYIYKKQKKIISEKKIKQIKRDVEERIDPLQAELAKTVSMGKALIERGSVDEARILLEGVLSLASDNLHANGLLGMSYIDEQDYKNALEYFERVKDKLVEDYYGSYAYAVEKTAGSKRALPILNEAIELYPDNDSLRLQLAILCFNLEKYHQAYKEICRVLDPALHDRKYEMVKAVSRYLSIEEKEKWINLGALAAAAKQLKAVHNKYPDDEKISFHLVKYYLNIGELRQSYDLLCESKFSDLSNKEWNKHPYYMAKRDRESFFSSYLHGHPQRLKLPLESLNERVWKGESLEGKNVVIMREQGIGDELIFAHNYNWIIEKAKSVSIFCAERLKYEFSRSFPAAKCYSVLEKDGTLIYPAKTQPVIFAADIVVFSGDIPAYCYRQLGRPLYEKSYYKVDEESRQCWLSRMNAMMSDFKRPKVGLIWRSGSIDGLRSAHYLNEKEMAQVVSALPEVDFFNCMYVECNKEINYIQKRTGRKIHQFDDLNQKDDFKNTAAMLSCLDLLVGAYTATTSIAVAVGTDLVAYASDYLREDGVIEKEPFYYPNTAHVSLPVSEQEKREEAIMTVISIIRLRLSI